MTALSKTNATTIGALAFYALGWCGSAALLLATGSDDAVAADRPGGHGPRLFADRLGIHAA